MTKPLRCSAYFWCGLALLLFLLGGWVDSQRTMSRVSSAQPGSDRFWSVTLEEGEIISYSIEEETGRIPTGPREISFHREPGTQFVVDRGLIWREMRELEKVLAPDGTWQVALRQYTTVVPYSVIMIVFLLVWLLPLMLASAWRRRRAARELATG
jgi:hypothetical protein